MKTRHAVNRSAKKRVNVPREVAVMETICAPTPTLEAVRSAVDSFILSLPLGTDPVSAEIEEAIAHRLITVEVSRIKLQKKLYQWVQVATELYRIVEDQQGQLERLQSSSLSSSGRLHPSCSRPQNLQTRVGQLRELLASPDQTFSNGGHLPNTTLALWQDETNGPRSFLESAPAVLSEIHNLKNEVEQLKMTVGGQNNMQSTPVPCPSQPQQIASAPLVQHQGRQQGYSSSRACEQCEVMRTQLKDHSEELAKCMEEQSRLRRSLLDAEIELQRFSACEDTLNKQVKDSESSITQLKTSQDKVVKELETERKRANDAEKQLRNRSHEVQKLKLSIKENQDLIADQSDQLSRYKTTEGVLHSQIEEKAEEVEGLKQQLVQLLDRIAQLECDFQSQERSLQESLASRSHECEKLKDENGKLKSLVGLLQEEVKEREKNDQESKLQVQQLTDQIVNADHNIESSATKCSELQRQLEGAQQQIRALEAGSEDKESSIANLHTLLSESSTKQKLLEGELQLVRKECEEANSRVAMEQGASKSQLAETVALREKLQETERELNQVELQFHSQKMENEQTDETIERLEQELESVEMDKVELEKTIAAQMQDIAELNSKIVLCETRLTEADNDQQELQTQLERQRDSTSANRMFNLKQEVRTLSTAVEKHTAELATERKEGNRLRSEVAGLVRHLEASEGVLDDLEKRIQDGSQPICTSGEPSQVMSSMKRLQGLLYSRERDLRRSQLKVEQLQAKLQWWEKKDTNSKPSSHHSSPAKCPRVRDSINSATTDSESD